MPQYRLKPSTLIPKAIADLVNRALSCLDGKSYQDMTRAEATLVNSHCVTAYPDADGQVAGPLRPPRLLYVIWDDEYALVDTANQLVLFSCYLPRANPHGANGLSSYQLYAGDFAGDEPTWDDIWPVLRDRGIIGAGYEDLLTCKEAAPKHE